ncbi:GNAT family N-acetyltransferase [Devosia salina]|nr:GNAT family N-acetyltransferase [Devosia salina]
MRNEPRTRAMSLTTDVVTQDQHEAWFAKTLASSSRKLYVAALPAAPDAIMGVCRFDIAQSGDEAEISINLAEAAQGQGLSPILITSCVSLFQVHNPAIRTILARVRHENVASQKSFLRAGFQQDASPVEAGCLWYRLEI